MKEIEGGITAAQGFEAAGVFCGIKMKGNDLGLIVSRSGAIGAGVYTKNTVRAAPVNWCARILPSEKIKGIIINSGNANACTGKQGEEDCREMATLTAKALDTPVDSILVSSTGVIGNFLPMARIRKGIPVAVKNLSAQNGEEAAQAIMTTDTFRKVCAVEYSMGDKTIRIGGIAKGSGMIHVNMATMLGFITTDAALDKDMLNLALFTAVERSFNLISVDGDTSTNDTVICLANGMAGNKKIIKKGKEFDQFIEALTYVCLKLAKLIVRDGEGATKFVEINIKGAATEAEARNIGMSIARSNLVKTALFGEDPNWGRILAAAGNAGEKFDLKKITFSFDQTKVFEKGAPIKCSEAVLKKILQKKEFQINLELNKGKKELTVFTCDLSYDYVKINAKYRT